MLTILVATGLVLNTLFPGFLAGIGHRNHQKLKKIIRERNNPVDVEASQG